MTVGKSWAHCASPGMYTFDSQTALSKSYGRQSGCSKNVTSCWSPQQRHVFPIRPCCETCIRGRLQRKQLDLLQVQSYLFPFSEKVMSLVQTFISRAGIRPYFVGVQHMVSNFENALLHFKKAFFFQWQKGETQPSVSLWN